MKDKLCAKKPKVKDLMMEGVKNNKIKIKKTKDLLKLKFR